MTDQQLAAKLVASDEFYRSVGGTACGLIDAAYALLLGRSADTAGQTYWSNQLTAGQSRLEVAEGIASSTENQSQLINDAYFQYLGRAADAPGLAYWLDQFAACQTSEDFISGFTGSAEYHNEQIGS